ncbi:ABC transporter [Colletotrichum graminicola M1.001]|uniref:ABC transporter n=1 Tax=Colletotrichum graminicola (strain M1.001 / M2 / FGSC 10212) TaxID=645133 RepID=E3Q8R0_COLGM|nr:ABC transporter [Colletotrichum graminicola M1.001]EFQ27424.1 ABC transporter [Colletotrichum graminicola M1.001]
MATLFTISQALHYGCALSVLLGVSITALIRSGHGTGTLARLAIRRYTTPVISSFFLLICTYLVETVISVIQSDAFGNQQARLVHLLLSALGWSSVLFGRDLEQQLLWVTYGISLLFEVPLLVLGALERPGTPSPIISISCQSIRIIVVLLLPLATTRRRSFAHDDGSSEESQPFLSEQSRDEARQANYGTDGFHDESSTEVASGDSKNNDEGARMKRHRAQKLYEKGGRWVYLKQFAVFIPFFVTKNDRKVQLSVLLCLLSVAGRRAMNILIPRQLGIITDLTTTKQNPYGSLAIWLLFSLLNGQSGLGFVEGLARITIEQFSYRQLTNAVFNHVMSVLMEFHAERDSAEIMKAIYQGESLRVLLEVGVVNFFPTTIDMVIALGVLYWKFNAYVSLAMLTTSVAFVTLEVFTSNFNIANRRASSQTEREQARTMYQAIQGWQTVSYFNMFGFEKRRFSQAVSTHLAASPFFVLASLVLYEISQERASTGDFVLLLSYWSLFVYPLKSVSNYYRFLMRNLVDAERLLELLQTKSTIVKIENATVLGGTKGHVTFEDVGFSYDPRRPTIHNLNISAAPGETIASVEETGAGKSTIMKLLLRFYDVTSGRITIDGHDLRDITLNSLREVLGVVPQDPLLFNASVMENVRYARLSATEEEIFDACRAAAIHEKILTFADGYGSKVGEQVVKLSGGEVQRLAIARVFLKNPPVLILDEATSAVDTKTEASIQHALDVLKSGRTTFIIAHRLSTVVNANKIVVIHEGRVAESGTHNELLTKRGIYEDLWRRQIGGAS